MDPRTFDHTVDAVFDPDHISEEVAPEYETEGSVGMDLRADLMDSVALPARNTPSGRMLVPTGLRVALPPKTEAQVRPRSGLAHKHGITVLNSPGTIDTDYRGEIKVLLDNQGSSKFWIDPGDRIAQIVFAPVKKVDLRLTSSLDETGRGEGGFGSTGT